MKTPKIRLLTFTRQQREGHIARQIAPGDDAKQRALLGLPLFAVAVFGGGVRKRRKSRDAAAPSAATT